MGICYAKLFEHGFYLKKTKLGPDLHAWRYTAVILFGYFYRRIWESFPIQKWPLFSQFHVF